MEEREKELEARFNKMEKVIRQFEQAKNNSEY
jgi:flagellar capping protein FliD